MTNKIFSRRTFLRTSGLGAAIILPGTSLLSKVLSVPEKSFQVGNSFSLKKLKLIEKDYVYPVSIDFNINNYTLKYKHISIYPGTIVFIGDLLLTKKTTLEICNFELLQKRRVEQRKMFFNYVVNATVSCSNNLYASPKTYSCQTALTNKANEVAFRLSNRLIEGKISGSKVLITENSKTQTLKTKLDSVSWKWGLIDMVQRMAATGTNFSQFAVIDEFDSLLEPHEIRFNRTEEIETGVGGKVNFKVYDQVGYGVIPTVFWVDESNRVAFIVSGMEAFLIL